MYKSRAAEVYDSIIKKEPLSKADAHHMMMPLLMGAVFYKTGCAAGQPSSQHFCKNSSTPHCCLAAMTLPSARST